MDVCVLSAGTDSILLCTRNQVMRSVGCTVTGASTCAELVEGIHKGNYDLFVLCHSLPIKERDDCLRLIKANHPLTPAFVVMAMMSDEPPPYGIMIENQPDALVSKLLQFFQHAGLAVPEQAASNRRRAH